LIRAARRSNEESAGERPQRTPRDQRVLPQLASRAPRELRYEMVQFGCRDLVPVAPGVSPKNFRWVRYRFAGPQARGIARAICMLRACGLAGQFRWRRLCAGTPPSSHSI
jgi:hypothetical protein